MRLGLVFAVLAAVATPAFADDADDMPAEARAELSAAIDLLKTHHMNRAGVDWPAVESDAWRRAKDAKTAADTYPAIWSVIGALREKHTQLIPADTWKATMTPAPPGSGQPSSELPQTMHLVGGIGFLFLPHTMGAADRDRAYTAVLRTALQGFARAHVCRFIVDLRLDTGGGMFAMIGGLLPLLGKPPYGYFAVGDDPLVPWIIDGSDRIEPDLSRAAVAVLVGGSTGSAGEYTAMAFEGRPGTRFFGEPSSGYITANKGYPLPDGAMLLVSQGWGTDRLKRPYRSAIVPDEATERGQPTLDAAIGWLKKQPCR